MVQSRSCIVVYNLWASVPCTTYCTTTGLARVNAFVARAVYCLLPSFLDHSVAEYRHPFLWTFMFPTSATAWQRFLHVCKKMSLRPFLGLGRNKMLKIFFKRQMVIMQLGLVHWSPHHDSRQCLQHIGHVPIYRYNIHHTDVPIPIGRTRY